VALAKSVFISFHYDRDYWRVQNVIQMGAIEGGNLLSPQDWEATRRRGQQAIKNWIDRQMAYTRAVVVLVGAQTATRDWVIYEITKAWNEKRPLVGIRIHGLKDSNQRPDTPGPDPFARVALDGGGTVANYVTLYDPVGYDSQTVHASIRANLTRWVDSAYKRP
jgi:hypothetical protein